MLYWGIKETSGTQLPNYHSCYHYSLDADPDKLARRSFKILNLLKNVTKRKSMSQACKFLCQGLYILCIMSSKNHLLSNNCHFALCKAMNPQCVRWAKWCSTCMCYLIELLWESKEGMIAPCKLWSAKSRQVVSLSSINKSRYNKQTWISDIREQPTNGMGKRCRKDLLDFYLCLALLLFSLPNWENMRCLGVLCLALVHGRNLIWWIGDWKVSQSKDCYRKSGT